MIESILAAIAAAARTTSLAEAVAVVLGLAYALLVMRRNRWGWVAGGISSALLAVLAARARLPMQALLQAYYVAMAFYGWWSWSRVEEHRITRWSWPRHLLGIGACLLASAFCARLLAAETQAAWPYLDSATTVLSLLATYLVARQVLENWFYWLAIDSVSSYLFAAQGLRFTATLFVTYLGLAIAGYLTWLRQYRQQTSH